MRLNFAMNPGWLKRLAILSAVILGQSQVIGQISMGQSKQGMRPEAVAQVRDYYKKIVDSNLSLDKLNDRQRLDYATNLLMIAETADMKEEVKRWKKEIYLNHTSTPPAIYFRKMDGWSEVTSLAEQEYCDTTVKLDNKKIGQLGNLMVAMFREHGRPKSYKEVLLTFLVSEESRPSIATMMKEPDQDAAKQEEYKALRIIIGNAGSPENQIVDLDQITGSRIADCYKIFLFEEKITETERAKNLVGMSAARAYLRQSQPGKAREAMSRIQGSDRLLDLALIKAYDEFSKGATNKAIEVLDQFVTVSTTDGDKKKARETQELLRFHESNEGKLNALLKKSAKAITRKNPGGFLVKVREKDNENGLQGYLRINQADEAFELLILKNKKLQFGYKVNDAGTAIYFPESDSIKKMATRLWTPNFNLDLSGINHTVGFQFNGTWGSDKELGKSWAKVMEVAQRMGNQGADLESLITNAKYLFAKIENDGHSIEFRSFDGTAESKTLKILTDKDQLPSRIESSKFTLEFISWDGLEAEKASSALWPKAKEETVKQIDAADYMRLVGQVVGYLQEANSDKPAEMKPAGEK